jgi:thiamine biosynthesis lipoprotein
MGAIATLQVHHEDRSTAERGVQKAVAEVRRLERIFSLYRGDSALMALNREAILIAPPRDLVLLLGECRRYWELTDGAFDPTVQALWTVHRNHFSRPDHDPDGPSAAELQAALDKLGFHHVAFNEHRIVLARRGMGLTLNGIAQGYMTDRAVEVLRAAGIERSLVDIGESRVLGHRMDGGPWRIGIADPDEPDRPDTNLEVVDEAVATSGPYGFRFDAAGRFHHLFDPQRGASAHRYKSVTVITSTATAADGLSTAFSLLPRLQIERALRVLGEGQVRLITETGERITLMAPRS